MAQDHRGKEPRTNKAYMLNIPGTNISRLTGFSPRNQRRVTTEQDRDQKTSDKDRGFPFRIAPSELGDIQTDSYETAHLPLSPEAKALFNLGLYRAF